jgi:hypothetical protein
MENEDKFFSAIEDTLHSYEGAYPAGAWEDFREKRKRKKALVLFFRLGSAAAVFLFLSYATIQFFKKDTVPAQVAQTKNISRQQKNDTLYPTPGVNNNDALVTSSKAGDQNKNNATQPQIVADKQPIATIHHDIVPPPARQLAKAAIVQRTTVAEKDNPVIANVVVPDNTTAVNNNNNAKGVDTVKAVSGITTTNVIARTEVKKYTGSTKSVYDSIFNNKTNKVATVSAKKNEKNLSYGVVVSPALGNQKFNFGTGVEVAYKINKNFFVSSGIAYSSLNATGGGGKLYAAAPGAIGGTDVNLQVSGFEVPIGLQYRTDNGFYVSAGIVAMGVTNNKLEYNYVAQTTAAVPTLDAAGFAQNSIQVVNEKKTEDSKEKLNNYLGFYIMSIGKKKKIGNNQFTFGPFVRVPFGAVSSQKISLFQGGITLGFDF